MTGKTNHKADRDGDECLAVELDSDGFPQACNPFKKNTNTITSNDNENKVTIITDLSEKIEASRQEITDLLNTPQGTRTSFSNKQVVY